MKSGKELFEIYKSLSPKDRLNFDSHYLRYKFEKREDIANDFRKISKDGENPYFDVEWIKKNIIGDVD